MFHSLTWKSTILFMLAFFNSADAESKQKLYQVFKLMFFIESIGLQATEPLRYILMQEHQFNQLQ